MAKNNGEFTKGLGQVLSGAKALYEFGVEQGLTTPNALRLTVMARQAEAKKLTASGVSRRKVAKTLGVHKSTVDRDVAHNEPKNGSKRATHKKRKPTMAEPNIIDPPCPNCSTEEALWHNSYMHLAGNAISMQAYWTRTFGKEWKQFAVTSDLITLAEQAVASWQQLVF